MIFLNRMPVFLQHTKFVKHFQWHDVLYARNLEAGQGRIWSLFTTELERKTEMDSTLRGRCHLLQQTEHPAGVPWVWDAEEGAMLLPKGQKQLCLFVGDYQQHIHHIWILHLWKHAIVAVDFCFALIYFMKSWQINCLPLLINFHDSISCHGRSCNSWTLQGTLCL